MVLPFAVNLFRRSCSEERIIIFNNELWAKRLSGADYVEVEVEDVYG